jgi:hypothetical protein
MEFKRLTNEKAELDVTLTTFATTVDQLKAENIQVKYIIQYRLIDYSFEFTFFLFCSQSIT